jgi:hypothetical protein
VRLVHAARLGDKLWVTRCPSPPSQETCVLTAAGAAVLLDCQRQCVGHGQLWLTMHSTDHCMVALWRNHADVHSCAFCPATIRAGV